MMGTVAHRDGWRGEKGVRGRGEKGVGGWGQTFA
jgi:hypothetical protein